MVLLPSGSNASVPVAFETDGAMVVAQIDLAVLAGTAGVDLELWLITARGERIRVGGAHVMEASGIRPVTVAAGSVRVMFTGARHFVVRVGAMNAPPPSLSTRRIVCGKALRWEGTVRGLDAGVSAVSLAITERTTGIVKSFPVERKQDVARGTLLVREEWSASVPWEALRTTLTMDWLDPELVIESPSGEVERLTIPRPSQIRRALFRLRSGHVRVGGVATYFGPFYTYKARRLSIHATALAGDADDALRSTMRFLRIRRLLAPRQRPLWVIGETGYKAQDTGYHLFRHVRQHHPEVDARFVVEADSPDRAAVEAIGPVLVHGTPEHIRAVLLARRIVSSHHPEYLYPIRTSDFKKSVKATKVFIQHGVLGTKWIANLYGRGRGGFETDLFLVSSKLEKRIVERDFGYPASRIRVTGLTRFDSLLAPSEPQRQLLILPTWRDWVVSEADFIESDFFRAWLELIGSQGFKDAIATAGWRVRLLMHPNFRHFASLFEEHGVEILHQGDRAVQDLLRESAVLLTDYSSVGFDFALLRRPVVYFQFDRSRFLGAEGPHLDLDEALPGFVEFTPEGVVEVLSHLAVDSSVSDADFAKATRFFPAMDRLSSERVFAAIKSARPALRSAWGMRAVGVFRGIWARFSKSRFYAPYVRTIYWGARLLPLQRERVLFESGLGRRYGDSPRMVYEQLVRDRPDLRKTWSYSGTQRFDDENTDVVERLSVRYFVLLARAGFIVSNQSLHQTFRRRTGQEFLQTWHGTPLKRMVRDLPQVVGRDSGYVERATYGASQWSVLVSPSPFATEAMRSAFGYTGRVLELGYPRNDVLHGERAVRATRRVRRHFGIPAERSVVLFAPTFRDRELNDATRPSPGAALDLEAWVDAVGDAATLLVRRHVLDSGTLEVPQNSAQSVFDATDYPDMQDLLAAADVLVTDYSSAYFDFLNLRRPIVFFAPDLEDYRDIVRGFYLDFPEALPGPLATEASHARALILEGVKHGHFDGYDLEAFAARFCPRDDGRAAARVAAAVFGPGPTE